jgi:hypothetical protein
MPWSETTKMQERMRFVLDAEGELFTMTELLRALRDQSDDWAQVGQAVPAGWGGGFGGPMSGAAALPSSDRCGGHGSPGRGSTPAPLQGRP